MKLPDVRQEIVPPQGEIRIVDLIATVMRHRKLVIVIVGAAAVVSAIAALVFPQTFTAKVSILPPEKSERSGLSALLSSASSSMLDFSPIGENRSSDYFLDVLRSKTIADSVLAHVPEAREYFSRGTRLYSDQVEAFAGSVNAEAARDGLVSVTVQLSTGYLASTSEQSYIATLCSTTAGALAKELDHLNRVKIFSRAHNSRVYIEEQLQRVKHQLDSLYSQFTDFQKEYKVLALDKQVESEVRTAADLQSQIMELEYQRNYRLRSQTPANAEMEQLRARISSLKDQYNTLKGGGDSTDYFLPFPQIPQLQKMYANMARDLKAMEQVYAYLQTQYFQERVQEERDTPTVQVLDAPQIPDHRTSPKRLLWVLFGVLGGGVIACLSIMGIEMFGKESRRLDERDRIAKHVPSFTPHAARGREVVAADQERRGGAPSSTGPPTNGGGA